MTKLEVMTALAAAHIAGRDHKRLNVGDLGCLMTSEWDGSEFAREVNHDLLRQIEMLADELMSS